MVLRMKNFNIFWAHWKIWLLRGSHEKPIGREKDCLKRGLGLFADLKGVWQERGMGGGVFEVGGWDSNAHNEAVKFCL